MGFSEWDSYEFPGLTDAERQAPSYLLASVQHAREVGELVLRRVDAGEALDDRQGVGRLVKVSDALLQSLTEGEPPCLDKPRFGPDRPLSVIPWGPLEDLLAMAYASAIRPLVSWQAHRALAELDRKSASFLAMLKGVEQLASVARALERRIGIASRN